MLFNSANTDPFTRSSTTRKDLSTTLTILIYSPYAKDVAGQFSFLTTLLIVAAFGTFVAIPALYKDYKFQESSLYFSQFLGCLLSIESLINWVCIKHVDSTYDPVKHGDGNVGVETNSLLKTNSPTKDIYPGMEQSSTAGIKRTTIPYFSWCPCIRCDRPRPPRCHHCPICNKCILKRDHHCFFTGTCIGFYNLRHFSVMLLWTSLACVFAVVHMVPYYLSYIYPYTNSISLIPLVIIPVVTVYLYPHIRILYFIPLVGIPMVIVGFLPFDHFTLFVIADGLFYYTVYSIYYFKNTAMGIYSGKTMFEAISTIKVCDTRDTSGKLRAVFGRWWFLNIFVPLHLVFKPMDDPILWPSIEVSPGGQI